MLIVDDDKPIRSFCKNLFKKLEEGNEYKFEVEEAEDGSMALMKILEKFGNLKKGFDLIVSDDNMTYLDGSNMLKTLLYIIENKFMKLQAGENILSKIIICSSDAENVKRNTCSQKLENFIVCEKPLNMQVLKKFINL